MTQYFYIHIPFCNQKCPYCKFALTPVFDAFKKRRYIEFLKKEISTYFEGREAMHSVGFGGRNCLSQIESNTKIAKSASFSPPNSFGTFSIKSTEKGIWNGNERKKDIQTIYFGGGTPSVLSHEEIREILECFPFYREPGIEITLESNPEDITREYVEGIIELGINRLSMGVQTLNDVTLTEIHRSDRDSIMRALENIETATNATRPISINIDFILGLPYTTSGEILHAIKEIHSQFPYTTHTSVYMLEDESYPKHWKSNSITASEMQSEFLEIMEYFESIGWHHYELSNFAKPGYESVHNQAYWDHSDTRGFGLSAASYEDSKRWNNASSFGGYYEGKMENEETLTTEQIEIEKMMFGLRRHGYRMQDGELEKPRKIRELEGNGLIHIHENTIKPTKTGIFLIDHILSELLV